MGLLPTFGPLLGSWAGTEEQLASDWATASTARSMLVSALGLAGTAVLQDYRQVRADGAELLAPGVFLLGADDEVSWWLFDSYAFPPVVATGRWTGERLTLTKTTPRGTARHRFQVADDRLAYDIDVAPPGRPGELTPFIRGHYGRMSGH